MYLEISTFAGLKHEYNEVYQKGAFRQGVMLNCVKE